MRYNRLWRSLLVIVAALGPLLVACGGEETPRPGSAPTAVTAEAEQVTIRFAVYNWERAAYEDLIEIFEEANPGLHIQFVSIEEIDAAGPMGWPDWALRRVWAADVTAMRSLGPASAKEGLFRDLTPFMEADPNFQPDDFYPGTLESCRGEGSTWALPMVVDVYVIAYHKGAFDEAGVPYPEPGWTWEDLAAKANELTVREGDEVARWGLATTIPLEDLYLIESRAAPLVDTTTEPPRPRFDRPEVAEALGWYAGLHSKAQAMACLELPNPRTLYSGRLAAMWVQTFTQAGAFKSPEVGIVPFPVDDPGSHSTPLYPQVLVMSAGTQHPDAAWRWMDFLSRQAVSGLLGRGPQHLPARRSVAETSGFWDTVDEELVATLRYAADHSYTPGSGPDPTAARGTLDLALRAILDGEKPVEEAVAWAQEQALEDIREYRERLAQVTPVPPFVVAPLEGQKPSGEGVVTISFAPGLGTLDMQRYRDLATRFHATHPDIVVEVEPAVPGSPYDLQGLAKAADCFLGYPSLEDPRSRAAILNLEAFLDADPSFPSGDFYPQVFELFTVQGQLWGLPGEVEPYVIEYNKDLFDAAGLDYPAPDWTAEDFVALAVALTQGEGEARQWGFVPHWYEGYLLPLILERLGGRVIDRSVDPPALSFDDPATVEALRWYAGLATVHGVRPLFITDLAKLEEPFAFSMEWEAVINQGRAAMWTIARSESTALLGPSESSIGVAPLPVVPGGAGGCLLARGYFISAQAEAPQACWEWISFLSGQVEAVEGLPARRSLAESGAYGQRVGEERAVAYRASVAGLERPFQVFSEGGWLREAMCWLFQAYGQVLEGEAGVEEALRNAQRKADDYRACVMARDAFHDQEGWRACLKEVDPTLPDFLFEAGEQE